MPAAAGSFDKAIPMSGSLTNQVSVEAASKASHELAARCGGFDKLRTTPAEQILSLQSQIPGARWGPVRDGHVIKEDAADVLKRGEFTRDMNLMIGHTRDESTLFTIFNQDFADMDTAQLQGLLESAVGDRAGEALERYEKDRSEENLSNDPIEVWSAVSTDRMFRIPAVRTADAHRQHTANVWMYRFDWESPAHEGRLHSCHSLDIPFVWGTYDIERMRRFCGAGNRVARLSNRLMQSYISFAQTGNPNHDGIPEWPRYAENRSTMCFSDDVAPVDAPMDATREFWLSNTD